MRLNETPKLVSWTHNQPFLNRPIVVKENLGQQKKSTRCRSNAKTAFLSSSKVNKRNLEKRLDKKNKQKYPNEMRSFLFKKIKKQSMLHGGSVFRRAQGLYLKTTEHQ